MPTIDAEYKRLCEHILKFGFPKKGKNPDSSNTSIFGYHISHRMEDGFPLMTTKKMDLKNIMTELLWFLKGETNIKYLVDRGCNIWNDDAYKNYCKKCQSEFIPNYENGTMTVISPASHYGFLQKKEFVEKIKTDSDFANKWGELGPIYGKQWRRWTKFEDESKEHNQWYISSESIDQIQNLIEDLKTNPDSRRLMVNAWNVAAVDEMTLPPCHYGFQVWTRELSLEERANWLQDNRGYDLLVGNLEHDHVKEVVENESPTRAISLMWNQRSVDMFLGLPYNIASYALLLEILASMTNMVPEDLIGNLGDCHIYDTHLDAVKTQMSRTPKKHGKLVDLNLQGLSLEEAIIKLEEMNDKSDIFTIGYDPHPYIKAKMISQV